MIPHLGVHHLSRGLRNDHVGFLDWHMTVNAFVRDRMTHLFRHATALPLMTTEAFERIGLEGLSGGMHIVAGRTTHLRRRSIAFTALQ